MWYSVYAISTFALRLKKFDRTALSLSDSSNQRAGISDTLMVFVETASVVVVFSGIQPAYKSSILN